MKRITLAAFMDDEHRSAYKALFEKTNYDLKFISDILAEMNVKNVSVAMIPHPSYIAPIISDQKSSTYDGILLCSCGIGYLEKFPDKFGRKTKVILHDIAYWSKPENELIRKKVDLYMGGLQVKASIVPALNELFGIKELEPPVDDLGRPPL